MIGLVGLCCKPQPLVIIIIIIISSFKCNNARGDMGVKNLNPRWPTPGLCAQNLIVFNWLQDIDRENFVRIYPQLCELSDMHKHTKRTHQLATALAYLLPLSVQIRGYTLYTHSVVIPIHRIPAQTFYFLRRQLIPSSSGRSL